MIGEAETGQACMGPSPLCVHVGLCVPMAQTTRGNTVPRGRQVVSDQPLGLPERVPNPSLVGNPLTHRFPALAGALLVCARCLQRSGRDLPCRGPGWGR